MKLSSSVRFAVVLSVQWLLIGADCCPPREETDVIHLDSNAQNLVQEPNDHFVKRITQYFHFGGVLHAIHELYQEIPRADVVKGGASLYQDRSSGKGYIVHASHFIRAGAIHEKLGTKNPTLNIALKNFLGKTEDMDRCWNGFHSIGGDVDRFQSSNLNILAEIKFNKRLEGVNEVMVANLADKYQEIMNKYDGKRSDTSFSYKTESWTITHVLNAETIKNKIKDRAMLFHHGAEGFESVNNGSFVETWTPKA